MVSTNFEGINQLTFQKDEDSSTYMPIDDGTAPTIDGLFITSDATIIGVGRDHKLASSDPDLAAFGVHAGTSWKTYVFPELGCHADAVHGNLSGRLAAAGACGDHGVIWEKTGDMWTEIYRSPGAMPFVAVRVTTRGQIFATGDAGTVRGDGTTWIVDDAVHGRSLSGDDDDMWLAGYFTNIQRFDGARWAQVTTQAITTMLVSVGDDDITFPGAATGRIRLVRDQ